MFNCDTWLPLVFVALLACSGCFLTQRAQSSQLVGRYRSITDFSRDLQTMRGNSRTVVYKNGRQETLQFKADHRFTRVIKFSTERVKGIKHAGSWQLTGYNQIQVLLKPVSGQHKTRQSIEQIIEYYRFDPSTQQMIRLGPDHKKLSAEWAPYYTFNRLQLKQLERRSHAE